jgi:hypothetical protein
MIRFFLRLLREKEKTRVFAKDSRAEARRNIGQNIVFLPANKQKGETNKKKSEMLS